MSGNPLPLIKVLYLVSLTPRRQHLPIRIVNSRKKIILEDAEYSPFPFLVIPQEDQGEIVNFEVEFPRNRRFLQGVPFYELEQAGVTVSIAREDNPTQILQFYSGTFVMNSRKMWISRLQKKSSSRLAEIVRILRWNTQLPTKPGWYWLWEEETSVNDGEPAIVEVAEGKFGLEVHFSGTELTKPLKTIGGQWGGPIPLPED